MLALTPKVDFIPTELKSTVWKPYSGWHCLFIYLSYERCGLPGSHLLPVWVCSNYLRPVHPCLPHQGKANGGGTVWISILFKEGGERLKEEEDDQQWRERNKYVLDITRWQASVKHSEQLSHAIFKPTLEGAIIPVPILQMGQGDSEK